jgi:hypothetical protein
MYDARGRVQFRAKNPNNPSRSTNYRALILMLLKAKRM